MTGEPYVFRNQNVEWMDGTQPRVRQLFHELQRKQDGMGLRFHLRWWKGLWDRLVWDVEDWWDDYQEAMGFMRGR